MSHQRTYIPQLINLLRILCKYLVRYRTKIVANGGAGTAAAVDVVLDACEALLTLLPVPVPTE